MIASYPSVESERPECLGAGIYLPLMVAASDGLAFTCDSHTHTYIHTQPSTATSQQATGKSGVKIKEQLRATPPSDRLVVKSM